MKSKWECKKKKSQNDILHFKIVQGWFQWNQIYNFNDLNTWKIH